MNQKSLSAQTSSTYNATFRPRGVFVRQVYLPDKDPPGSKCRIVAMLMKFVQTKTALVYISLRLIVLVVSPVTLLMKDQVERLEARSVKGSSTMKGPFSVQANAGPSQH